MSDGSDRKWVSERVALIRDRRHAAGHDLSALEHGIIESIANADPAHDSYAAKELEIIRAEIEKNSVWKESEEWRISTYYDSTISYTSEKHLPYQLKVECDGQVLSCACPVLEVAYAYLKLYQRIIVNQFYSVGPPWAKTCIQQ